MAMARQILLADVARAYYLESRTQSEIAQSLGISRSQVSRYLREARELGLVQIRIITPEETSSLGADLSNRYPHLAAVIVAPHVRATPDAVRTIIGRYAANYISQTVLPGQVLALGCGRTLLSTVQALPRQEVPGITLVQAMGNLGHEAHQIDYNEITRLAAATLGGRPTYVSAPAILGRGSGEAKGFLDANPIVEQALALARKADVYIVGLGSMESDMVYARFGLIESRELADLAGRAVGDICGRFFSLDGRPQPSQFGKRIIGIELDDLCKGSVSIGVAGGRDKAAPILAAIRGRYINVIVTDEQTLASILALDDSIPMR